MTIRVDMTNKDDVPLFIEQEGQLKQLQPGESGTFYVKKDARITLREDMRKDRFNQNRPDRRQRARRYEDDQQR